MAWYDSLLSGANTLGNLYNAFQPAIQTGASVYNRNQQNNAIGDAVGVINQAGQQNQNTLRSVYDQGMGMVQPYNQAGTQALSSYQNLLSNPNQITNDPGYRFRVDKGNQEVTRNAAANRMLGSGNFAIALQDYGQKSATSELDSALNRQIPLMNSGLSSINTAADLGRNFAYGTVGVNQAMADATAGGMLGRSASNTGMLSDLFGIGDQNRTNQPSNPLGQVGMAANQAVNGSGGSVGNLSNSLSNLFGGGNAAAGAGALNGLSAIGGTGLGTGATTLGSGGFGSGLGATGLGGTGIGGATTLPGMGGTTAAFEGMTSGIGAGVGTGGSTAAAGGAATGSIGLLGSLGIIGGIIGIGKALQNIKGGAAEGAKTGKLYKDLRARSASDPTGQAMYARVDDLVENRLWPNEGNGWVIGDLIKNNVISVDYPTLHSSQSVVDLWNVTPDIVEDNGAALRDKISKGGDDRYWDRATGRQRKETQTLVNSASIGPKAIAATYGLTPEQQQQYAQSISALEQLEQQVKKERPDEAGREPEKIKVQVPRVSRSGFQDEQVTYVYVDSLTNVPAGGKVRVEARGESYTWADPSSIPGYSQAKAQYDQVRSLMTEDRKRLYAESLYDQLRSQGYTGDLSKLERYLGVA